MDLFVSENTVKTHVANVLAKLHVRLSIPAFPYTQSGVVVHPARIGVVEAL